MHSLCAGAIHTHQRRAAWEDIHSQAVSTTASPPGSLKISWYMSGKQLYNTHDEHDGQQQ
jgi:hypothetical protein